MLLRQFANLHSDKKQISVGFVGYLYTNFIYSPFLLLIHLFVGIFTIYNNRLTIYYIPQRGKEFNHQHIAEQEGMQGCPHPW